MWKPRRTHWHGGVKKAEFQMRQKKFLLADFHPFINFKNFRIRGFATAKSLLVCLCNWFSVNAILFLQEVVLIQYVMLIQFISFLCLTNPLMPNRHNCTYVLIFCLLSNCPTQKSPKHTIESIEINQLPYKFIR